MKKLIHATQFTLLLCTMSTYLSSAGFAYRPEDPTADTSYRYDTGDPELNEKNKIEEEKQREAETQARNKAKLPKNFNAKNEDEDFDVIDETTYEDVNKPKIKIKTPAEKDDEFEQAQEEHWKNRKIHTKIADWFRRTSDQEMVKQALNGNPEAFQELKAARQKLQGTDLSYRGKIEALNSTVIREITKEYNEIAQDPNLEPESKERAQRILLKTALKLAKEVNKEPNISKVEIDENGNVQFIKSPNTTITYDSQGNIKTLINNSMQQTSNSATREADTPTSKLTTQSDSPEQPSRTSTSAQLEARKALDAQQITTASKELTTKIKLLTKKRIIDTLMTNDGLLNNIGQRLSDKTYLEYFIEQADKLAVPQNKLELFETFISLAKDSKNANISTDDLIDEAFTIVAKKRQISEGEALRKKQNRVTPKLVTTAGEFDYNEDNEDEDNN